MATLNDFVVAILSHGRADKVYTYKTLRDAGYTGDVIIVIDDMDKTRDEYEKTYPGKVYVFDKKKIKAASDSGNNFNDFRSTIYPRNAMVEIVKKLGYKYFIQFDDDYIVFKYMFDKNLNFVQKTCNKFDQVIAAMLKFIKKSEIKSLCFAQGGDFIGGANSSLAEKVKTKRKGMNSFISSVDNPIKFFGQMNEDVNTVIKTGSMGDVFLMTNQFSLDQKQTQKTEGGMTEIYLDSGTYVKTFYSVMYMPNCAKVSVLKDRGSSRIHHKIRWKYVAPMIVEEKYKKRV
jgi:hypothetical protein